LISLRKAAMPVYSSWDPAASVVCN